MDAGHLYLQNCIVYARSVCFSICEYIDGNFHWTLHCHLLSIRLNHFKVCHLRFITDSIIYTNGSDSMLMNCNWFRAVCWSARISIGNEQKQHTFLFETKTDPYYWIHSFQYVKKSNFPLQFIRQYRVAVTMIWLIALSVNLPWLYVFQLEPIELGSNRKVSRKKAITLEVPYAFF